MIARQDTTAAFRNIFQTETFLPIPERKNPPKRSGRQAVGQRKACCHTSDVIKFLNSYGIECEDVETAQTTGEGDEKTVTIKYKNGQGSKTISADGSYKTDTKDGDDNNVTTSYTKDGVKTKEVIVSADSHLTTETIFDEQGNNPTQKTETNTSDNTVLTTTYKDGKCVVCYNNGL